jgi:peroxiredoxin
MKSGLRCYLWMSAAAGSTLLPSIAQAPIEPVPGAAQTPPAAIQASKDSAAQQRLASMILAHARLKSFSATLDSQQKLNDKTSQATRSVIKWQKPNRVAISTTTVTGDPRTIKAVSNGTHRFMQISSMAAQYLKATAPTGADAIPEMLDAGGAGGPAVAMTFSSNAAATLQGFLTEAAFYSLQPAVTINGVACDVVEVGIENPRLGTVRYNIAIGQQDNLLRRLSLEAKTPQGPMELVETFRHVQVNPVLTNASWAFTPPKGARAVDSLEPPTYNTQLKVGAQPFAFQAKDTKGRAISLQQYRGKVLLLDFWASWCGPCVHEMPNVIAAYNKWKPKGFDILGISFDEDRAAFSGFVTSQKMMWRQIYDGQGWNNKIGRLYGVQAIPFTLLIGRDGKIAAVNPRGPALETAIAKAIAKK